MPDTDAELLGRIDERTKALERRLARVEIGILSILIACGYIVVRIVLNQAGLPT